MLDLLKRRWLDIAVWVTGIAVVATAAYLGYSIYARRQAVEQSTPAGRAVRNLILAVRQNPSNLDLRINLAEALIAAGRENDAIEQYRAVLGADKKNASALSGLGFLAAKRKDWKSSEEYWRQAIDSLSEKPSPATKSRLESAYFYMGTSLVEQHRYEDAIGYLNEALRLRRDASDTHYLLAAAYRGIDEPEKYREELEVTLLFDPKMPEANHDLGQLLLEEGDVAGAAEHFRVAVDGARGAETPAKALAGMGDPEERLERAKSLAGSKEYKAALVEARVAVALEPEDVAALRVLAVLWERNKDKAKALEVYRTILRVAPGDSAATKAIKRLSPRG